MGAGTTLVSGGTGYLGSLILARLLVEEPTRFLVLVRRPITLDALFQPIALELELAGYDPREFRDRLQLAQLPALDRMTELDAAARELRVDRVIHAAGCLDYFDRAALRAVNVDLTAALLDRARAWGCRRFAYLSTAFSSGFRDDVIREQIHRDEKFLDPTEYTKVKREAEILVADSGVPAIIIRPSVVIGHSRDGHYTGKQYGLYQLWYGMERLLFDAWRPCFHAVGPQVATHFLHQDAFQDMFAAAWRNLPDGAVLNAVSNDGPTLREVWEQWLHETLQPMQIEYFPTVASVPVKQMDRRQRSLLALASVNLDIAVHPWQFEITNLERLAANGLSFARTTFDSLRICQRAFVADSKPIQAYLRQYDSLRVGKVGGTAADAT